jgi:hypothetical protein
MGKQGMRMEFGEESLGVKNKRHERITLRKILHKRVVRMGREWK